MASIIKRKKAYSVIYNYTDEDGNKRQKWETWHTYKEAQKRKAEIENQLNNGTFIIPNSQIISEFMYEFVCLYGEKKWGVSTYNANCALIANYINPIIGDLKVQDVTTRVADSFVQTLQKTKPVVRRNIQPKREFLSPQNIEKIVKAEKNNEIDLINLIEQLKTSPELATSLAGILANITQEGGKFANRPISKF